ncbi:hypothetical protein M514_24318 [Trichuris suis]|uniref:Uncharacterized protein n=1 Tax=Trichuris suis TaxID=68888 RepID=A0A085N213_9BILA|nr:hypothetical protein M514_24318 [Trichuris suis]
MHPDKADKDISYFQSLRDRLSKQQLLNMLSSTSRVEDDGLRASYNISLLTAKSGNHIQLARNYCPRFNDTVQRRIDEVAKDVEDALCSMLRKTAIRSIYKRREIHTGAVLARELVTDTKGESTFQKDIPLTNIMSVATDGALSMTGSHRGFIAYLKQVVRYIGYSLCYPSTTPGRETPECSTELITATHSSVAPTSSNEYPSKYSASDCLTKGVVI